MAADPDRFNRHGPVRVSADRTHLIHAGDGTPFFFLSDTAWNGALLSTVADWARYLDDRAAKGFTAIQFITHAPWTGALTNREGETAFANGDPRAINPIFFDRIDRRIEMINDRGLLAVPVLAWAADFGPSGKLNVGLTSPARELIPFVHYQVARFAHRRVMWVLAGDGAYGYWQARKWNRVGREVFGGRNDHTPVAMHPVGTTWPHASMDAQEWLDVNGYQSSHSEDAKTLRWLQQGPPATAWRGGARPRPTINLEPVYEGIAPGGREPFGADAVRRAVYWSLLNAPTAGVSYGAHGLWGWHDRPMAALNHANMGIGPAWDVAMAFPGAEDMACVARLFTSIRWWTLRPDQELIAAQPSVDDPMRWVAASRSETGDLAIVYLAAGGEVTIRRERLNGARQAFWFDPRTGERFACEVGERIVAPDGRDWVWVATD